MGAELIGWREKRKPRGQNGNGPIKHGLGMALHKWGGGGRPGSKVSCTINPDGSVELKSATQDIGTGARTILAIIAAEILGLQPTDIISNIGNSTFPPGQASGGSTTTPVDVAAVLRRRHQGPGCAVQEDRAGRQCQARGPFAQGRAALGLGRAGDVLEGRLPQARRFADLRDRLVRRQELPSVPASAAASSPRSPWTSRPAWSRSRRSSPSRTRA